MFACNLFPQIRTHYQIESNSLDGLPGHKDWDLTAVTEGIKSYVAQQIAARGMIEICGSSANKCLWPGTAARVMSSS